MRILLTGSSGFVGGEFLRAVAASDNIIVRPVFRTKFLALNCDASEQHLQSVVKPMLTETTDWQEALIDIDTVVHAAARVHFMTLPSKGLLSEYRNVNVKGTLNLARQAAESGVKRFVFISTVKVNGEETFNATKFSPSDAELPAEPYALSKWEAEQGLRNIAKKTGMEVVIIRPVLVYGPGVKANFHSMMKWLHRGVPLPLGAINNKRSLVSLDNLVDFIITCVEHPAAANETFLVSDGDDLSTTELLQRMAKALQVSTKLIPIPSAFLKFSAGVIGKRHIAQRLCGSLQVDISKNKELLGWVPPVSVDTALEKTAAHFLEYL